jgi:ABC-type phosphate transport system substrate-binding protein
MASDASSRLPAASLGSGRRRNALWASLRLPVSFGGLLACIGIFTTAAPAAPLRLAGTDLLGKEFAAALQQAASREGVELTLMLDGSRAGLARLRRGDADLAIVMLAPDETPPAAPLVARPWVHRIAVVAVAENLPITQLTFEQLGGVFGGEGYATFTEWHDLGVSGEAARRPLHAHALETLSGNLALDVFRHTALRTPRLRQTIVRHARVDEMKDRFSSDLGGIAILPAASTAGSGLRIVSVAKKDGDPAFGPTAENVETGDYPLRWPVYLVVRGGAREAVQKLWPFLWSDEATRLLAGVELVPLPARVRAREVRTGPPEK